MRRLVYIIPVLLLCIVFAIFALPGEEKAKYEMPKYEISQRDGEVEIRHYTPFIVAYTDVEGDAESASDEGFRRLFRYISGENRSRRSVAMTAPVAQSNVEPL